ncbi:hypothetical protein D9611_009211 [Ephemerocybe angulata]|uniref:Cytochrome P450 n=1 Tax=Ephemerocybe angulata TaxID=980116 RepID=A0A8H5BGZ3_9AGAR|nr:hypothetical protein D9611_009211 [Tulosesus angulatus]
MATGIQVVGACVVSWVAWKLMKWLLKKDPLANIRGPPSSSRLLGNIGDMISTRGWAYHKHLSDEYGGLSRVHGFLGESALYVYDPKALQHIIVKEQYIYDEAPSFTLGNEVVFGKGLLATLGDHHKKQRKALNPVFSTAHMREMVPIFYGVVNKLEDVFQKKVQDGPITFDVLSWMTRTALELVGQSGLGYSFDPLTEDGKEHPFSISLKQLIPAAQKVNLFRFVVLPRVCKIGPAWLRRAAVNLLSAFWTDLRRVRDIIDVMSNTSVEIYESKKAALKEGDQALESHVGRGKDIISILLKANMAASEVDRLPDDELIGQISTLTFAGMDTTSNALARILYQLTQHPDVQEKMRQEITEAQTKHGRLDYNELMGLPYLDAVCRETLRTFPPVPLVTRMARQDMVLPMSRPIVGVDGKEMHEVVVPKGTRIFISALASNRNPELWGSDSYEWKPERWLSPLPDALVNAKVPGVYSHLMTFLGGGRACIGFKFSELEMKLVLAVLIPKFRFALEENKEIFWQMGTIVTPIIDEKDGSLQPQLPLIVSAV